MTRLILLLLATASTGVLAEPADYRQVLPRGVIASVDQPRWASGRAAALPDDALVFGVLIAGQAHAFSLNLLNSHEIVNDTINGQPYAAVW